MGAFFTRARAIDMRCFCPPDKLDPAWAMCASYPSGMVEMNSSAWAMRAARWIVVEGSVAVRIQQVGFDRSGEQHAFLRNIADFFAQIAAFHIADVDPVHQDAPRGYIVKADQQVHQGRFTAARHADKCGRLPVLRFKADIFQHRLIASGIAEGHVFIFNIGNKILPLAGPPFSCL